MDWSSAASRAAPGIWALAASCVGSKRPPRGMETCSLSSRRSSPVSWCWRVIHGFVGGGTEGEDGVAADGRGGKAGDEVRAAAPTRARRRRRFRPGTEWDRAAACASSSLAGAGRRSSYPCLKSETWGTQIGGVAVLLCCTGEANEPRLFSCRWTAYSRRERARRPGWRKLSRLPARWTWTLLWTRRPWIRLAWTHRKIRTRNRNSWRRSRLCTSRRL